MNKKIFDKLKEIGWLEYHNYDDYFTFLSIHRKLLEEQWELLETTGEENCGFSDDLINSLAFTVDLLLVLERESN